VKISGAVLVPELGLGQSFSRIHHQARAVDGDLFDVVLGAAETTRRKTGAVAL